jgi:endonuclease YncB( thermonuclease family)
MVNIGWPPDSEQYSEGYYSYDEAKEAIAKRGLWNAKLSEPWGWRKDRRRHKE